MASFGIRLLPKGKTLGTGLFLITSPIEWYKLHSHSAYCTEVMALYLQRCKAAEILCIYAFSVHNRVQILISAQKQSTFYRLLIKKKNRMKSKVVAKKWL